MMHLLMLMNKEHLVFKRNLEASGASAQKLTLNFESFQINIWRVGLRDRQFKKHCHLKGYERVFRAHETSSEIFDSRFGMQFK
jgi:hypothetical protein